MLLEDWRGSLFGLPTVRLISRLSLLEW